MHMELIDDVHSITHNLLLLSKLLIRRYGIVIVIVVLAIVVVVVAVSNDCLSIGYHGKNQCGTSTHSSTDDNI